MIYKGHWWLFSIMWPCKWAPLWEVCLQDFINIYIYIYISKNWNIIFIIITLRLSHISGHIVQLFLAFSLFFLIIFLLINLSPYNYHSSNISQFLLFYLSTTLYISLTIHPSLHIPFILTLLFLMFFSINICFSLFHSIYILI